MKTFITSILSFIFSLSLMAQLENSVRLKITDKNGVTDETAIRINPSATKSFDASWDAKKLFSTNPDNPSIFTKLEDGTELSINSFYTQEKDTNFTVYTLTPQYTGEYTIEVEFLGEFDDNLQMGVKNNATGDRYIFNGNDIIAFTSTANANEQGLFSLFYAYDALVDVANNDASITKPGSTLWTYYLYNSQNELVENNQINSESFILENLANDDYYLLVNDAFGFTSEANFSINTEEEGEEENENQTLAVKEHSLSGNVTIKVNQQGYLINLNSTSTTAVYIHSINGQLIAQQMLYEGDNQVNVNSADFRQIHLITITDNKQKYIVRQYHR